MPIQVIKERCPQNHRCPAVRVCPFSAIEQEGSRAPTVKKEACVDCGKCVFFCPMGALVLIKASTSNRKGN
jgi:Fe-S-cluster-containing hydrogenase component 2